MNTKLHEGEEILNEWKDQTDIFKGGNRVSRPPQGSPYLSSYETTKYGTLYLTNHRIIFESSDGKTLDEISLDELENSVGENGDNYKNQENTSTKEFTNPISYVFSKLPSPPQKPSLGEINLRGKLVNAFGTKSKSRVLATYNLYCGAEAATSINVAIRIRKIELAREREEALDYEAAIEIWDELGKNKESARIRKKKTEEGAVTVTQKVIHGDEVTKTEIKDSVLNRSNVGTGKSKSEELRETKALLDDGIINDDEFKQMKKEILGK